MKVANFIKRIEKAAREYKDTEYCECGCKGREDLDHGAVGKHRFKEFVNTINPLTLLKLVKNHRDTLQLLEASKNLYTFVELNTTFDPGYGSEGRELMSELESVIERTEKRLK